MQAQCSKICAALGGWRWTDVRMRSVASGCFVVGFGDAGEDIFDGSDFDGLGEVEVEASLSGPPLVVFASPTGEGDQDGSAERRLAAELFRDVIAIHAGKPDVQENDVGLERTRRVQGLCAAMGSPRLVAAEFEHFRQADCSVDVVINHQDAAACLRRR